MKVWISTISTSKFSGINTLWAAMMRENFIPDRIHLINLTTKDKKNKARETTLKGYHSLLQRYGAKGKPVVHDVESVAVDGDNGHIVEQHQTAVGLGAQHDLAEILGRAQERLRGDRGVELLALNGGACTKGPR